MDVDKSDSQARAVASVHPQQHWNHAPLEYSQQALFCLPGKQGWYLCLGCCLQPHVSLFVVEIQKPKAVVTTLLQNKLVHLESHVASVMDDFVRGVNCIC